MTDTGVGEPAAARRRWPFSRASLAVVLAVLVCTGLLSWLCFVANQRNEHRLLDLQTQQTGALLQVIVPVIETPLASAAEIAATSSGDASDFTSYMQAYVGRNGPFVSTSLWQITGGVPRQIAAVGRQQQLGGKATAFLDAVAGKPQLHVTGPLGSDRPTLGYAYASDAGRSPSYVVYAESALPADRYTRTDPNSPFGDLNFALYLGKSTTRDALLETNSHTLPIPGDTATITVPFGTSTLTLVATAGHQIGGTLLGSLWWIVALIGVLLAVLATLTSENLVRRRRAAEQLTGRVASLLREQRSISATLQHALLPAQLPAVEGLDISTRYLPGVSGVEIGGDWYDVMPVDAQRCFLVVGDVSGRGVAAGAVMASLNFAIRGFVTEGHEPAAILSKLTKLLDVVKDGHFATVLCGLVDIGRRQVTFASAGHLPPLVVAPDGASSFPDVAAGPPIGIGAAGEYRQITVEMPPRCTLIAYTDGLVERRGESLDDGLNRLRAAATGKDLPLDDLVSAVVSELLHDGNDDDTAILGVRWRT